MRIVNPMSFGFPQVRLLSGPSITNPVSSADRALVYETRGRECESLTGYPSRCGGTADAPASEAGARKGVEVQLLSPASHNGRDGPVDLLGLISSACRVQLSGALSAAHGDRRVVILDTT